MLMETTSLDPGALTPADISGLEVHARLALRVDVSALSMMDQVLMRKYLRQISSRRNVEWTPTDGRDATVAVHYRGALVRLVGGGQEQLLPHPIHVTQLDSALSLIAQHCLAQTAGRVAVLPTTLSELLIPQRKYQGPLRVVGSSFGVLYFDRSYRHAWSVMSAQDLHKALSRSQGFDRVEVVTVQELDEVIASGGLQPVSVESLCWSMDNRNALAQADDGFANERGMVRLSSWPNLAWQADFEDWIPALIAATSPISHDQLRRRLVTQGIPLARVDEKLRLLSIFGRLESAVGTPGAEPVVAARSAPASMFGRLRSRLRAMLAVD